MLYLFITVLQYFIAVLFDKVIQPVVVYVITQEALQFRSVTHTLVLDFIYEQRFYDAVSVVCMCVCACVHVYVHTCMRTHVYVWLCFP